MGRGSVRKAAVSVGTQDDEKERVKQRLLEQLANKHKERLETLEKERSQLIQENRKRRQETVDRITNAVELQGRVEDVGGGKGILQLPDEVVEMIFENLKDPQDLYSCSKTCPRFQKVLEPKRKLMLFPQVLSHVMKYLKRNDFLNCHRVCKSWDMSVRKVVEHVFYDLEETSEELGYAMEKDKMYGKKFRKINGDFMLKLCNFFGENDLHLPRHLKNTNANFEMNPVIGRRLQIQGDCAHERFWKNLKRFLNKFGKEIWEVGIYMTYDGTRGIPRVTKACNMLKTYYNCLVRMPNLKKLAICCRVDNSSMCIYEDELEEIREELDGQVFPPLPYLTDLTFDFSSKFILGLIPSAYWQQVKKLTFGAHFQLQLNRISASHHTSLSAWLPTLKSLDIDDRCPCSKEDLEKLQLLPSPLETLRLTINDFSRDIHLSPLLQTVNHFGQTLRQLDFGCKLGKENRITVSPRYLESCLQLYAPKLKTLKMHNVTHSLNFLLRLESLEHLFIEYAPPAHEPSRPNPFVDVRTGELIKIHGFIKKTTMYKSNIWTMLPSLKSFHYKHSATTNSFITRKGYEDYKNKLTNNC